MGRKNDWRGIKTLGGYRSFMIFLKWQKKLQLIMDKNMVINFASPDNKRLDEITKYLRVGKMLVERLEEWRGTNK